MGHRTPLYQAHTSAGAKIVDFGGWDMPLHYGSQVREHQQVRQHAGMFDVSHMTVVDVSGADACTFLRHLLANDVARLTEPGTALYSVMLNHNGGVVDDLIVYYLHDTCYRLVVNCATREKDLAWMRAQSGDFTVTIDERPDLAIIAVQGPAALRALDAALVNEVLADDTETQNPLSHTTNILEQLDKLSPFHSITIDATHIAAKHSSEPWLIARTGYTGEDGVEIILPSEDAESLWNALRASGTEPVGLGARDTLRLEAGLNLYGHEMDEETSPLEANLAWTIAWQDETRDFVGRTALKAHGKPDYKLVGLVMMEKGVLRAGQTLSIIDASSSGSSRSGHITSGTFSPSLQCGIALARIPVENFSKIVTGAAQISVNIRGKSIPLELVKPPFVRHGKKTYVRYNADSGRST